MSDALGIEVLRSLANDPQRASSHVLELLQTLKSSDVETAGWAADALQVIDTLDGAQAKAVMDCCSDCDEAVAGAACMLLTKLPAVSPDQQHCIAAVLDNHRSIYARQQAALAMSKIKPLCDGAVETLRKASTADDARLARLATQALEQLETV